MSLHSCAFVADGTTNSRPTHAFIPVAPQVGRHTPRQLSAPERPCRLTANAEVSVGNVLDDDARRLDGGIQYRSAGGGERRDQRLLLRVGATGNQDRDNDRQGWRRAVGCTLAANTEVRRR